MANKVWFITGISRGLGLALANAVLARGDVVIGTTRSSAPELPANDRLRVLTLDVADRDATFACVAAAHAMFGRIDVVVNNAGFGLLGPIEAADDAEIRDVFAVNFFGPLDVVQAALPFLRAQRSGHLVNIASIAGIAAGAGSGVYAAAKSALVGLSESLAQEVASMGVKVTVVAPGAFRTDFLADTSLRYTRVTLDAYAESSGKMLAAFQNMAGKQLGDPERAATAICELVDLPTPPLHLLLGSDALKRTRGVVEAFTKSVDANESLTRSTDFPDVA